ncbi:cobalamin biosynthesis protein CbiX [Streptomyces sp. TP-A0875]|uniref:cobalamin biosynthesis protein CbiX n=1 Tax=Streptomyces sp. TP-A0875 TaxID=552354 RepID=UPI00099CF89C|nr:cobalamin biosynthesis protein CbiX [Streptomyces sp. TP-A0875]
MPPGAVIAVGGHESDGGRALRELLGPGVSVVSRGRELLRRVVASRGRGEPVCVVPMTLGRDPELTADAARTLLALSAAEREETVLADPFGTTGHLVGWLRAAAGRVPAEAALLITAPCGDPFVDADLFRVARLVRQYGHHHTVEVAFDGGDPDPAEGVRRCRALGSRQVVLVPAAWTACELPDPRLAEHAGPLLPASAVAGVLDARVREAWQRRRASGDDGVARGLTAAHDHGHGHSHGPSDGHGHSHGHGHPHPPAAHPHGPHSHGPVTGAHGHPPATGSRTASAHATSAPGPAPRDGPPGERPHAPAPVRVPGHPAPAPHGHGATPVPSSGRSLR